MRYRPPMQIDADGKSVEQRYVHYRHVQERHPLTPLQYGWHATPSRYGYGPTIRDHFLIHFVYSGSGKVVVDNRQYYVGAGQCFAIFPHQITYYEASADHPWMYLWVGFEGQWGEDMMAAAGFSNTCIAVNIPNSREVFGLLFDLRQHIQSEDFFLLLTGYLYAIFYQLRQRDEAMDPVRYDEVPGPMRNEYVRILLSIIHTSYSERINVEALADRLGLNRCYMTDLFRKHTGQSIKAYLHEYRLQRALIQLQNPNVPVKSAALECGFHDPLYFSRAFRARFGMSPQQYRASVEMEKN
ncbi:MAG TPA: AraC family transcriptional regulator [Clostridia bacterium]|nr:AraC family transcriptional regulator [Clostridia bacterium]